MDNEKYGIELELVTNKFNQKMQEVKKAFTNLTDKKVNLNTNIAQIEYLKKQIGELTADLQVNAKTPFWNTTETLKAKADLEKLTNQYNKLIAKQNELGKSSSKASESISKSISKATSKIKRFGFSLLSFRSIFALVSRASSAYLSQDTELAERLQRIWIGLGAIFSPIIEFIASILEKAIGFINGFVKALTGVDLIARASTKSINKTTGAVKSLNKALGSFDELQNLDTDAGGGGTGLGNLMGDLNDLIDDSFWWKFRKWFLGSDKTDLRGIIQDNIETILEFVETIKIAFKPIANWVNKNAWQPIKKTFGEVMEQLKPLIEPVKKEFNKATNEIRGYWEDLVDKYLKPLWDGFVDYMKPHIIDPLLDMFMPIGLKIYNALVPYANLIIDIINTVFGVFGVNLKHWEVKTDEASKNTAEDIETSMQRGEKASNTMTNSILGYFKEIMFGAQQVSKEKIEIKTNTSPLERLKETLSSIFDKLKQLVNRDWKISTKIETTNFLQPLRNALSKIGINLPQYAVGTSYVPQDQIAMLHKGEAVVPKKFNSKEYFGDNTETNEKLDDLIEAVRNIEINPYTTIRDVGKASLSYINNKSRQLGESVVV